MNDYYRVVASQGRILPAIEFLHDTGSPNGISTRKSLQVRRLISSIRRTVKFLYPRSLRLSGLTTEQRNWLIRQRFEAGEGLSDLARHYGISPQRVYQIIHEA